MLHLTSCLCDKQIMYFLRLQVTISCFSSGACSNVVVITKYHFRITLENWKYNCYFVPSKPKDHIVILQYFTHLTLGLKDERINDKKNSEHVLVHDILIKHISHFFSFFITLNLNQIVFFLYGHLQLSNNNL